MNPWGVHRGFTRIPSTKLVMVVVLVLVVLGVVLGVVLVLGGAIG